MNKKRKPESQSPLKQMPEYGDQEYTSEEDIYSKNERVWFDDEGSVVDITTNTSEVENPLTGEDLDIPGGELDDSDEVIGEEDEENNYYSLGGDDHDDLEENNYYSLDGEDHNALEENKG